MVLQFPTFVFSRTTVDDPYEQNRPMKRHPFFTPRVVLVALTLTLIGNPFVESFLFAQRVSSVAQQVSNANTVAKQIAILADQAINESSGIVRSHINPNCFWTHNDSGDKPRLFLVNRDGKTVARVGLSKAKAIDWEDIAIHIVGDDSHLIIGDIGGNTQSRKHVTLYFLREPKLTTDDLNREVTLDLSVDFELEMEVTFPGGVTNYESIAVDHSSHSILIVEKGNLSGRVFTVPLPSLPNDKQRMRVEAKQVGVAPVPMATACDISADGRSLVIIGYSIGFLFRREISAAGEIESWKAALEREPAVFSLGKLRQTEAVCFSEDEKSIFFTSERVQTPIFEIDLPINPNR